MDYLQILFSMFNAPLFATFIIGMFWKRATSQAARPGSSAGTLSSLVISISSDQDPGRTRVRAAPSWRVYSVDVVITVLVSPVH